MQIELKVQVVINASKSLSKAASRPFQGLTPFSAALLRYGSAVLVAMASHWVLNDPGPSKTLVEELIKILLRMQ